MKKILLSILSGFLLGLPLLFVGWYTLVQAPPDPLGQERLVEIKPGTSTRVIAKNLRTAGLVRSELAFLIMTRLRGDFLKAGVYRLSPIMNLSVVINKLAQGEVAEHMITVPEGWRILEIASLLDRKGIVSAQDFLAAAQNKEGYLFPDTYRLSLDVSATEIVKRMSDNFLLKTQGFALDEEDVILASIVEREAKSDEDRRKIAAVYLNRIKKGMRLEADPTVQYAKTLGNGTIVEPWPKITTADYRSIQSPYNTYLSDGLPSGPICNPGLASLQAVLTPASIDDLYFFHTKDGQTIFSKTLDEHNTKKRQYDLAI